MFYAGKDSYTSGVPTEAASNACRPLKPPGSPWESLRTSWGSWDDMSTGLRSESVRRRVQLPLVVPDHE
jgi:hypothetical protein